MVALVFSQNVGLFQTGDVIIPLGGRTREGFIIGRNRRTGLTGYIPRFKLVEIFKRRKLPY